MLGHLFRGSPHPREARERSIVVIPRWTIRAAACALLLALAACGSATAATPLRPDEVQVIEPAGKEAQWTYRPNEIRVSASTSVTFVNMGKEFHTVTSSDEGRPFDLGLDSGNSAAITFDKVGVYAYHCGVHPQMKGVVRVCDGACG
jgi:plastocyanin